MRARLLLKGALAAATVGAIPCAAGDARADAVISVHASQGTSAFVGALHASDDEPDALSVTGPRLVGSTTTTSLGIQVAGIVDEIRFGLTETLVLPRALEVRLAAPLRPGFSVEPGIAWGGRLELFVGRELGAHGQVTPWIDLAAGVSMLSASLKLRHESLGGLGDTSYVRVDPVVSPRVGVRIPLGAETCLELFVRRDLIGPEQLTLGVALGVHARPS